MDIFHILMVVTGFLLMVLYYIFLSDRNPKPGEWEDIKSILNVFNPFEPIRGSAPNLYKVRRGRFWVLSAGIILFCLGIWQLFQG
jgi:hypothetical protein